MKLEQAKSCIEDLAAEISELRRENADLRRVIREVLELQTAEISRVTQEMIAFKERLAAHVSGRMREFIVRLEDDSWKVHQAVAFCDSVLQGMFDGEGNSGVRMGRNGHKVPPLAIVVR